MANNSHFDFLKFNSRKMPSISCGKACFLNLLQGMHLLSESYLIIRLHFIVYIGTNAKMKKTVNNKDNHNIGMDLVSC